MPQVATATLVDIVPLALNVTQVKGALVHETGEPEELAPDDPLRAKAKGAVAQLLALKPEQYDQARKAIDSAGSNVVALNSGQSSMLKIRLGELMRDANGGPVATSLINLRDEVSKLDPSGVNFTLGWWSRNLGGIPIIGTRLQRYMNRFETGKGVIEQIIASLKTGRATLENDNRTLANDQRQYRANTVVLKQQIEYLRAVDEELAEQVETVTDSEQQQFLRQEVLFPLRQRIQDLLQALAVFQQGVISTEIIIRGNRELIRGVDRAMYVTVIALQVGVTLAIALARQGLVIKAVNALNTTTNDIIAGNARRIREQGVEIQKQAASAMLDPTVLKAAFADLDAALTEWDTFRENALPQMEETITDLHEVSKKAEKSIQKMERGNQFASQQKLLDLDIMPKAA